MVETFGITYEVRNPVPWSPQRTIRVEDKGLTSLHHARSLAGYEIKKRFIKSVAVYRSNGKNSGEIGLYLVKDSDNHVIKREYSPTLS